MATILLQSAGAAVGGLFGPVGAILGRAAGALAGNAIDQKLFGKDKVVRGPALEQAQILSSADGAPMPRVYGRVRVGGQIVWATRYQAVTTSTRSGGKGGSSGTTVEETSYFANFAVAICEGPIAHFGRIWADGKEIDRTRFEIRLYKGSQQQSPDPLIEAKQGGGNAPAFRGVAYAVFDNFPLAGFGNRIPQLSFEVVRPVAALDGEVRAVCLIPGATEAGLHPEQVRAEHDGEGSRVVNRNNLVAPTDWAASLDELQALCPQLQSVALVVTWFGDDLRAGNCRVEPRVEYATSGPQWSVSGIARGDAREVSRIAGRPAYGGTPSDASVIAAIADLKARGLKVALYPFLMMDIPSDNELPDPHGGARQPAHPWRGRITCHPAPGRPGSPDGTMAAAQQVTAFAGSAAAGDFRVEDGAIAYPGSEWSWRRMVLHYAHLSVLAGGVDAFLIGSELRGLTTVRDGAGGYPFVAMLAQLSGDVRQVVGPAVKLTYGADWSEWFGHRPQGAADDFRFHLDPLWAHPAINAVGIDNYMPLSDFRSDGDPVARDVDSPVDPDYLAAGIAGGEGFDWFYADDAARLAGERTPITDGQGEPWIWRYKDIVSWWSNPHHERIGGARSPFATAWVPRSKPVWFTELGCPAVAMAANQPNVFPDPKSSESALPRFSGGGRHDLAQNRFLAAHYRHWAQPGNNPPSPSTTQPMVDPASMFLWAWDARPFPAFPARRDVWSDGAAWTTGHWLNGRIGGCPLDDLLRQVAADFGAEATARCDGFVDGYVVPGPMSAREALEPLIAMHGLSVTETEGGFRFLSDAYAPRTAIAGDDLVEGEAGETLATREDETELPRDAEIIHGDLLAGYESVHSYSRRLETASMRTVTMQAPVVMPGSTATALAESRLRAAWTGRDTVSLAISDRRADIAPGDLFRLDATGSDWWRVEWMESGGVRRIEARRVEPGARLPAARDAAPHNPATALPGRPELLVLNLPIRNERPMVLAALGASPWAGRYAIWSSPGENGFSLRRTTAARATRGRLRTPLAPGPEGRFDRSAVLDIDMLHGTLASQPLAAILNGANAAAVRCRNGGWEILQFSSAALQVDGRWRLGGLLRAQMGTDGPMRSGAEAGADFLLLGAGVQRVELDALESGLLLNWRATPAGEPASSPNAVQAAHRHERLDLRPLSPVHLSARREPGGVRMHWIRRTRIDGDNWDAAELPVGEPSELYRVAVLDALGNEKRTIAAGSPTAFYPAADEIADFGAPQPLLRFAVAQIGADGLPGTGRGHLAALA